MDLRKITQAIKEIGIAMEKLSSAKQKLETQIEKGWDKRTHKEKDPLFLLNKLIEVDEKLQWSSNMLRTVNGHLNRYKENLSRQKYYNDEKFTAEFREKTNFDEVTDSILNN